MTRLLITRGVPWVVRVNRDDLRLMLHGRRLYTPWAEGLVSTVQRNAVEKLLEARADVMVDDECVRRDAGRPDDERVGEPGIRDLHRKYLE